MTFSLIPPTGGFGTYAPVLDKLAGERVRAARERLDELGARFHDNNVEITGQARSNGQWTKSESLIHPTAFVLNRKEQREITKMWHIQADAVKTT